MTTTTASPRPRRPTRPVPPAPDALASQNPANALVDTVVADAVSDEPDPKADSPRPDTALTPLRAHYLKKTLVSLQFEAEFAALTDPAISSSNVSSLAYLGPPFNPPPKSARRLDVPFTKFIFRQFALTFPFLAAAPKDFFPAKLQPFITSLLSRDLSFMDNPLGDPAEDEATHMQKNFLSKLEKNFSFVLGSAVKLTEPEEVVRLTQTDLLRLEAIGKKRRERLKRHKDIFEVNVVAVRSVSEKGRVRKKWHEEFIIRTRRSRYDDIFVSRRYGDFRTLVAELKKVHPEEMIRPPPIKDKSSTALSATSPTPSIDSLDSMPSIYAANAARRLPREKNRLTLRSYLHSLMSSPTIASSPVLRSFLTANPITLTDEEQLDAKRREEADNVREEGRQKFVDEITGRVENLRGAIGLVKQHMMVKDGLSSVFAVVKEHSLVLDLPPEYQAVMEWGRTSFASTLFQHFVASDSSSENLASLKRFHGLMPYMLMKGILKISNPVAMIRGFLDIFLAQPFGGRSLLQRMFTGSLSEEIRSLQEDIDAVRDKIDDPVICEKMRLYIYAPSEIQQVYRLDAAAERMNVITCILRSGEQPALSRDQLHRVLRAHKAHLEYLKHRQTLDDSDDDEGPHNEEGWLYEDLKVLAKLYARLRDREQVMSLFFEGTTTEVLKDILTIFYSPLAQVYKAANIADTIGDLQAFITDLIRTVEQLEEVSQFDSSRTVRAFLDLVQRHEQSFYTFVHNVHTKGESLFSGLIRWIELFITFIREGLGEDISLEYILPHNDEARKEILSEVDRITLHYYKLKVARETKVRRKFGGDSDEPNAVDDEIAASLVEGALKDVSFGNLVRNDVEEALDGQESEESSEETDSDSADSDGSETDSESTNSESSPPPPTPPPKPKHSSHPSRSMTLPSSAPSNVNTFHQPVARHSLVINGSSHDRGASLQRHKTIHNPLDASSVTSDRSSMKQKAPPEPPKHKHPGPPFPHLRVIPDLLPLFVELVRPQLRPRTI